MAQSYLPHSLASLRAITYRISSTPTKQLPSVAAQISGSIWNCKDVFAAGQTSSKNEAANIVHRFKTTITSLLQDRTIEGRWAAVVLTKAAIEACGVEDGSKTNAWVRSLLAILKKPDPPTTRQLAAITLTRIFMLTWDHSTLVREITTPALPAFISTCVANAEKPRCSAGELGAVLEAFATLMPRHPTVFRTHESSIAPLVYNITSSRYENSKEPLQNLPSHRQAARRVFVQLHLLAPKQGGAEVWNTRFTNTITEAHATCDQLFRSIIEDKANTATWRTTNLPWSITGEPGWDIGSALGTPWRGILQGSKRLVTSFDILKAYLETASTCTLTIKVGMLIELISRVMGVTVETGMDSSKAHHQIPKDERETLLCVLPEVHVAALEMIDVLLQRFGRVSHSFVQNLLELVVGVFNAEGSDESIRAATYETLEHILGIIGPSMPKSEVRELIDVIKYCCQDLLPETDNQSVKHENINGTNSIGSKLKPSESHQHHSTSHLTTTASTLLPTLLTKLNPAALQRKSRVQIERTAILTRNRDALVACVLNPAVKHAGGKLEPSLLPILAREFPGIPEVEALLRPRMPVVVREQNVEGIWDEGVEEEDEIEEQLDGFLEDGMEAEGREGLMEERGENELYSITPPRNIVQEPAANEAPVRKADFDLIGTKRAADTNLLDTQTAAKKHRMSPIAEPTSVALSDTPILPTGPRTAERGVTDSTDTQTTGNEAVQSVAEKTSGATKQPVPVVGPAKTAVETRADAGDDDSDFEMPPLTMEPDTDPEEEYSDEGSKGSEDPNSFSMS